MSFLPWRPSPASYMDANTDIGAEQFSPAVLFIFLLPSLPLQLCIASITERAVNVNRHVGNGKLINLESILISVLAK